MNRRALLIGGGAAVLASGGATAASFARMGTLGGYAAEMANLRTPLRINPDFRELVRFATLAANGHNTQPWRFSLSESSVAIHPDFTRRTPVVDPDDHHLYASLGCAAENLMLAARASGRNGELRFEDGGEGRILYDFRPGRAEASPLFEAIPARQSTRAAFDGRAVVTSDLKRLEATAKIPGVDAVFVTDPAKRDQIRDLVIAANTEQIADPAFVAELKQWMRFNPRAALATGDGLFSAASGNPALPSWLGARMFDIVFNADAENEKYAHQMDTSAGVVVFSGERADTEHWVRVGRACQRFALQATALGLKQSFVNQPVEVGAMRAPLASLAGIGDRRPDIVMRFGFGPDLPKSPRRAADAVLV